jgi:hypothetical protein
MNRKKTRSAGRLDDSFWNDQFYFFSPRKSAALRKGAIYGWKIDNKIDTHAFFDHRYDEAMYSRAEGC